MYSTGLYYDTDTPYTGCIIVECNGGVDGDPYPGCIIPPPIIDDCTGVDIPYEGCNQLRCLSVTRQVMIGPYYHMPRLFMYIRLSL